MAFNVEALFDASDARFEVGDDVAVGDDGRRVINNGAAQPDNLLAATLNS